MKKLAVIIVNYNVCYFLEQALLSVQKAVKGLEAEVWVVDNASSDNSVQMVREKFPEVHLIPNKHNVGFSRANNQAIRLSEAEYVLLLNPDTLVEPDTFQQVCRFMDEHPEAGGLGVKMVDGHGQFLPESKRGLPTPWVAFYKIFGLSRLLPNSRTFGRYHLSYLSKEELHEVDVLSGAFMLMRKKTLDEVGLLDEDFFMYGEDIDLSYRITKGGYKNFYYPHTRILHYKGESTKKGSLNYVFVFYQAMLIFARKHFRSNQAGLYALLIRLAVYLRAGFSVLKRFLDGAWPVLLDAGLILAGMYFLKTYWEDNHKYVQNYYPPAFMGVAVPVYIAIWLTSVFISGGYDQRSKPLHIMRGTAIGTILIAAISNFADAYRFSKALIVLGGAWATVALIGVRLLQHFIRYRDFRIGEKAQKRILIVGGEAEAARTRTLLQHAIVEAHIVGRVEPAAAAQRSEALGPLEQLEQLITVYDANEVIFCGKDLSVSQMLDWMERLNHCNISFRTLPEGSDYIIGSDSKDAQGDFYKREVVPAIYEVSNKRSKRLLDLTVSLVLILFFPVAMWWVRQKGGFFVNCFRVLFGELTWVSVREVPSRLRPGILSPVDKFHRLSLNEPTGQRLENNYLYEYAPVADLDVIFRGFRFLGRRPQTPVSRAKAGQLSRNFSG